jgi:hypothetical protein
MTDDDIWGVTPNDGCTVDLTPQRENALNRLRHLRMIVPQKEFSRQTEQLLQRILTEQPESFHDEKNTDNGTEKNKDNDWKKPLELTGNAPYYDPQLDKAVECLQKK